MSSVSSYLVAFILTVASFAVVSHQLVGCAGESLTGTLNNAEDLYLEEIEGSAALEWVKIQNDKTARRLETDPRFEPLRNRIFSILTSPDKLIGISLRRDEAFNFWRDAQHLRGILRKTRFEDFKRGRPKWEIIIDFDELASVENENWVYKGYSRFKDRIMLALSKGGKDAVVYREFDVAEKRFVQDGFVIPEGKNRVEWLDENHLLVGLALKEEDVTDSGYPRRVYLWRRGTTLESAQEIFEVEKKDLSAYVYVQRDEVDGPVQNIVLTRSLDFYNSKRFLWRDQAELVPLEIPDDAIYEIEDGFLYVQTVTPWLLNGTNFDSGSLLRFRLTDFLEGKRDPEVLFTSTHEKILGRFQLHKRRVFLILSEHAVLRLYERQGEGESLKLVLNVKIARQRDSYAVQRIEAYSRELGLLLISEEGFLTPTTRYIVDLDSGRFEKLDQTKAWFDSSPFVVEQNFATSRDGTRIPYFLVRRRDMSFDGQNPTLIYGYGGFMISLNPFYSGGVGAGWLENGGVYVVANIRGGAEYGPKWHQAALKENRPRAYEDFIAVAEDLVVRKVTSPRHLGIRGGSNGGLLTGVAMTKRPDLFSAVVIAVPLLDMLRYHFLLAGASWMAEYGDPSDSKLRKVIESYSPYQNLKTDVKYPEPFIFTSTADDRVHPGHARRFAARMEKMGHPYLYFENVEGGHAGSANYKQTARIEAMQYVYLLQKLADKE